MTVEILNFTEALRLTDTGKRIIKEKIERHVSDQLYINLFDNFENVPQGEFEGFLGTIEKLMKNGM